MYLFKFFYIKYFEFGLEVSNFKHNKQNSYNDSSLSCNKINESVKISPVGNDEIKIVGKNPSTDLKKSPIGR